MPKKDQEIKIIIPGTDSFRTVVEVGGTDPFDLLNEAADLEINKGNREGIKSVAKWGRAQRSSGDFNKSRGLGTSVDETVTAVGIVTGRSSLFGVDILLGINRNSGRVFQSDGKFNACEQLDKAMHMGGGTSFLSSWWGTVGNDSEKILEEQAAIKRLPKAEKATGPIDVMLKVHNSDNDPDAKRLTKQQMVERVKKQAVEERRRKSIGLDDYDFVADYNY